MHFVYYDNETFLWKEGYGRVRLPVKHVSPHVIQVGEGDFHGLDVVPLVILQSMFLQQSSNPSTDERMSELRHGRKQMMFNLIIQITHPPIHEFQWSGRHVHRVNGRIPHPIHLFVVLFNRGQMGM